MYEAQKDAMESDGLSPQKIILAIILFIICFFIYIIFYSLKENYSHSIYNRLLLNIL